MSSLGMGERASWTLDELVSRVAAALATAAYPGSPNGRVREVPDRRAVRWYTTTGLVDRPTMQGRTAMYGVKQLLQVVAVKKLQAQGLPLAQIQAELAGATEKTLHRIADIPDELLTAEAGRSAKPGPAQRRARFWADPVPEPTANGLSTALSAVGLPGGVLLLLPAQPADDDIQAIRAAAGPLLELLADRGLLPIDERSSS
ncbi:MerR family transcriptional regulator [Mycobacterium asiaticum]|uniref:MerR family transcriptional regulator n=1 Tax=Mycobacterium asiaticum TaxID=1790 RepID=UPI0020A591CB|nr:MerR family transcriptional regulator [Mycobacterium asiaticum]